MAFDDRRASRRERPNRIGARHRNRQRKIARPKHGDRANAHQHRPHVRLRQRLAHGVRMIDPRCQPRAAAHHLRKQADVVRRAGPLPLQSRPRQRSFGLRPFQQRIAHRLDPRRDRIQQSCDRLPACRLQHLERRIRQRHRAVHFRRRRLEKLRVQRPHLLDRSPRTAAGPPR